MKSDLYLTSRCHVLYHRVVLVEYMSPCARGLCAADMGSFPPLGPFDVGHPSSIFPFPFTSIINKDTCPHPLVKKMFNPGNQLCAKTSPKLFFSLWRVILNEVSNMITNWCLHKRQPGGGSWQRQIVIWLIMISLADIICSQLFENQTVIIMVTTKT